MLQQMLKGTWIWQLLVMHSKSDTVRKLLPTVITYRNLT